MTGASVGPTIGARDACIRHGAIGLCGGALRLHLVPAARLPTARRIVGVDRDLCPVVDHLAAVLAAFGAVQVVGDVLHVGEVAGAAVGAALDAAIGRQPSFD